MEVSKKRPIPKSGDRNERSERALKGKIGARLGTQADSLWEIMQGL